VSAREVVEKVMMLTGGGRPLWGSHPYREGENMELYADISLAKKLLKWKPQTSLEDGLKKTIDYYRTLLMGGE
jgi:nucleoside-diphosphate-sugar epimerase